MSLVLYAIGLAQCLLSAGIIYVWIDGRKIAQELRDAGRDLDRLEASLAQLSSLRPPT